MSNKEKLAEEWIFESADNTLSILHDAFFYFLNMKAYKTVESMMDALTEANNVNEINTVLIITAAFKESELRRPFERLKHMLQMMLRYPDSRNKCG